MSFFNPWRNPSQGYISCPEELCTCSFFDWMTFVYLFKVDSWPKEGFKTGYRELGPDKDVKWHTCETEELCHSWSVPLNPKASSKCSLRSKWVLQRNVLDALGSFTDMPCEVAWSSADLNDSRYLWLEEWEGPVCVLGLHRPYPLTMSTLPT